MEQLHLAQVPDSFGFSRRAFEDVFEYGRSCPEIAAAPPWNG